MTHVAYILLGSNLGDRHKYLGRAREKLGKVSGHIVLASSIYETEPWQMESNLAFLNQAVKLETTLDPHLLLKSLHEIELLLGRIRVEKQTPREIDLDIGLFDGTIIHTATLIVPHPRLHQRNFVLAPLSEIAGNVIHPVLGQSIYELYKQSPDHSEVSILAGL